MGRQLLQAKHLAALGLVSWLALGCTGSVLGDLPPGSDSSGPTGGPAATAGGPGVVEGAAGGATLVPQAVPKLLRVSNDEYRNIVTDVLGLELDPKLFAGWTPIAQVYGFDTMSEQRIDAQGIDEQLKTVEALTKLALESSSLGQHCPAPLTAAAPTGTALTWDNCGKALVTTLASRAFRRPVRADELSGYQVLLDSSQAAAATALMPHPFYEALTAVVEGVLLSPNLVFKPELVPGGFDPAERGYAVASKLSLFFRSSIADAELSGLAQAGSLNDWQVVRQQAERLLSAYQARFTRDFGGQWLDFREALKEPDALMSSMQNEVRDVFDQVLVSGATARQLIAPGFTIVDQPLAAHYGLPFDVNGPPVQQIASDKRGGLLSQGLFLRRTATGSEFRRVIHRGLWTLTRLLCQSLPRLDAATLEEITESFKTIDRTLPLSQQMEIHRNSSDRCRSCHGLMDPIGLALENYDAQGLWRDTYADGAPIVSDLELYGAKVGDPMKLAAAIEASDDYRTCVATKLLTYAMNRGPTEEELLLAAQLARPDDGSEAPFKTVIIEAFMKSFELTEVMP